jgi:hypothetical protein
MTIDAMSMCRCVMTPEFGAASQLEIDMLGRRVRGHQQIRPQGALDALRDVAKQCSATRKPGPRRPTRCRCSAPWPLQRRWCDQALKIASSALGPERPMARCRWSVLQQPDASGSCRRTRYLAGIDTVRLQKRGKDRPRWPTNPAAACHLRHAQRSPANRTRRPWKR